MFLHCIQHMYQKESLILKSLESLNFRSLLLLSCFSRVRLCVTPQTAAHQAPPSLGFSRQEYWSGLPFLATFKIHFYWLFQRPLWPLSFMIRIKERDVIF